MYDSKLFIHPKKTYILTKMDDKSPLRSDIRKSFEDPKNYLQVDKNMIVGIIKNII
jgi:hypothetical protein